MSGKVESSSSPDPRLLVCAGCWTSFFSTPSYKEYCQGRGNESGFEYAANISDIQESATGGCSWCSLILSLKESTPDPLTDETHSPPLSLRIRFGSGIFREAFTPAGLNRFRVWLDDSPCHLTAFTTCDDPVSGLVTARELENNLNSEAAFQQIWKWLKECESHESCLPTRAHRLPTRVIEVSPESTPETPRLLVTNGLSGQYAALSYCWGVNQAGVTNLDNLESHLQKLNMHSLSRTLQDAIVTTRHIGIKYLWVDALCIIQDSLQDKIAELAMMCKIYQQALITIVAANVADANQGFLAQRAAPQPSTKVPFWSQDGRIGIVSLRPEGWYDDKSEPVNTRAWTLQERLLSPRLLIYATHTLQYQCQKETVNLGNSTHIPSGLGSWRLPSPFVDPCSGDLAVTLDVTQKSQIWKSIITEYSQRRLSYIQDKLTALAGIAEAFQSKTSLQYLAGLWAGELLPSLLLWEPVGYSRPCPKYTAPSWSWAALDSPVAFRAAFDAHTYAWYGVDVAAAETILESEALPYGPLTGGHLKLTARVRRARFDPPQYVTWEARLPRHGDAEDLRSRLSAGLDGHEEEERIICLALAQRVYEYDGVKYAAVDGLIIKPAESEGKFVRIGSFYGADDEEFKDCTRWDLILV